MVQRSESCVVCKAIAAAEALREPNNRSCAELASLVTCAAVETFRRSHISEGLCGVHADKVAVMVGAMRSLDG